MSRARDTADQINRVNSSAADATAITVDSSENVGVGESSVDSKFHVKNSLSSTGVGSSSSPIAIIQNERANTGSSSSVLRFDTNEIAGTNQYARAAIGAEYDDSSNVNGRLMFSTADTSGNLQERMRILSGGGITFNGDTAAANALNDYEEGTWTPSIAGDATYTARTGQYVKVGRMVTAAFDMTINAINSSAPGTGINGLPFTAGGSTQGQAGSVSYWANAASSLNYIAVRIDLGSNTLGLSFTTGSVSTAQLGLSFWKNGARMIGTITYVTT